MNLLEQEIKELREMNEQLKTGKIDLQEAKVRVGIYGQTEKRAKMILQAYALGATFDKNGSANIVRTSIPQS